MIRLSQRNKHLTAKLKPKGFTPISTAEGTVEGGPLYQKKKKVVTRLNGFKNKLRNDVIEKSGKRHFRKADTQYFDAQGSASVHQISKDAEQAKPFKYNITERAEVVQLSCTPVNELIDQVKHAPRIRVIETRAALCGRQETAHLGRQKCGVEE